MKTNRRMFLIKILSLIFMLTSCDEEGLAENALDSTLDGYEPPETTIIIAPGAVIVSNSTLFSYSGNDLVSSYSYRLDYNEIESEWSDWTADTTVNYDYLDDGVYTFYVKGRYAEEIEDESPASYDFLVDAVSPSSLRLFPQLVNADLNTIFDIEVYVEEINNVSLIQVELQYDNENLGIYTAGIQKGTLLNNFPGFEIFIDEEPSSNTILVTIGVGGSGSSSSGLSGTGSLFRVSFTAINVSASDITIVSAEFKDENSNSININDLIHGRVEIE